MNLYVGGTQAECCCGWLQLIFCLCAVTSSHASQFTQFLAVCFIFLS